jgi:hypothetical protein
MPISLPIAKIPPNPPLQKGAGGISEGSFQRVKVIFFKKLNSYNKKNRDAFIYFLPVTSIERDSMPPEIFRALKPFCRRMRVA